MADYTYYMVEGAFVVRVAPGVTERLLRDGSWESYPDRFGVLSEGIQLEDEEEAQETAKELFEQEDALDAAQGEKG
jgi:hypothetical protein